MQLPIYKIRYQDLKFVLESFFNGNNPYKDLDFNHRTNIGIYEIVDFLEKARSMGYSTLSNRQGLKDSDQVLGFAPPLLDGKIVEWFIRYESPGLNQEMSWWCQIWIDDKLVFDCRPNRLNGYTQAVWVNDPNPMQWGNHDLGYINYTEISDRLNQYLHCSNCNHVVNF